MGLKWNKKGTMSVLVDIHKPLYNAEFDIVRINLMPEKSCCIKVPPYSQNASLTTTKWSLTNEPIGGEGG